MIEKALILKVNKFKDLIEMHELNHTTAATRIGCSPITIRRALAGEPVSSAFVAACTTAFGIPMDALFTVGARTTT